MRNRLVLFTATAIGLVMGSAQAGDGNNAYLDQSGERNSASVTQSGNFNDAGSSGKIIRQSRTGTNAAPNRINLLTINQSGDNNDIGLEGDGVSQTNHYVDGGTWYTGQNDVQVNQTSNGNAVGAVRQHTGTHEGANTLIINQGDNAGNGAGNRVGSVLQYRTQTTRNSAEIDQTGSGNTVERVQQYVANLSNTTNLIDLDMTGDSNGNEIFTPGGAAANSGAQSSSLIQGRSGNAARDNTILLTLGGDDNEFGVTQYGVGNSVGQLTVSGNDNELGIYQDGTANVVALGVIEGDLNNIGVTQNGTNTATVNIFGADSDGNSVGVSQEGTNTATANVDGDTNDVTLVQGLDGASGGTNTAWLNVNGDSNRLNARQLGSNGLTVNIWGSDNNATPTFSGVALAAAGSLTPGDMYQTGAGNTATLNVGAGLDPAGGNRFAFNQDGDNNTLTGTINGDGNQAAVQQSGNSNAASISQTGNQNMVGVLQ